MRVEPTQARSRATVQAIVDAANAEIAEHGYHGAQMTQIATRAGVSPGSVYRFFPDKDSVCEALAHAHLDGVQARLVPIAARFESYEGLATLLAEMMAAAAELQGLFPGYYRLTNDVSPVDKSWVDAGERLLITQHLEQMLRDKGITTVDGAPDLTTVVEFAFEAVRTRLTTLPTQPPNLRNVLVGELTAMVTLYCQGRLRPATP